MRRYRIKSKFRFTVFVTLMMVMVIFVSGTLLGFYNAESATQTTYTEVYIQAGDTLWQIARNFGPSGQDTRKVVYEICQLNEIRAEDLQPGQTILVPEYI